jgi:hypothetical protein
MRNRRLLLEALRLSILFACLLSIAAVPGCFLFDDDEEEEHYQPPPVIDSYDDEDDTGPPEKPIVPLVPDEISLGAGYGTSVAQYGDTVVVGAPRDDRNGVRSGTVFVFDISFSDFIPTHTATLTQPVQEEGADYGQSVGVSQDVLVVGAPQGGGPDGGRAYVYERTDDTWDLTATLSLSVPQLGAGFGASVQVDNGLIVVGAPGYMGSGGAFVYSYEDVQDDWIVQAYLLPEGRQPGDRVGESVAISNLLQDVVVLGAPGDPGGGAAYVFLKQAEGFGELYKLETGDGASGDDFGAAVAVERGDVAVGAPRRDEGSPEQGATFVYEVFQSGTPTVPTDKFTDDAPQEGDRYGSSVSIRGFHLAIGRPSNLGSPRSGVVDVHKLESDNSLTLLGRVFSPNPSDTDFFGASVSAYSIFGKLVVGAPGEGGTGAAYVFDPFDLPGPPDPMKKEKPGTGRYLAFRAPKRGGPVSGTWGLHRDLHPPFRVELSAGSFRPDRREGFEGSVFGGHLERAGAEPREFYRIMVEATPAGLTVRAESEDGPLGQPLDLAGALRADLAADHDGSALRLLVRQRGQGEFQEVASIPLADPDQVFLPGFHIENLAPGAEVGLDDPEIVTNGDPASTTPETDLIDLIYEAIDLQVEASALLESEEPPGTLLADAAGKLAEALEAVEGLGANPGKKKSGPRAARKQVKKASRTHRKAIKLLDKGRPPAKAIKQIHKAIKKEGKAIEALSG